MRSDYMQKNEGAFAAQLIHFKTTIPGYATTLGVPPADVTAQGADADYFNYLVQGCDVMEVAGETWVAWRNLVRNGGTPPPGGAPVAPVLPTTVPAVDVGIEPRFRALVKTIKAKAAYNDAIGEALGIVGAEQTKPDMSGVQPDLEVRISGDHVEVIWGWKKWAAFLDMCEIQVDRADGKGFVMLAYDTTPGYNDTAPFPATPTKWSYRAIYRVDDARVGQWSKTVSVLVG